MSPRRAAPGRVRGCVRRQLQCQSRIEPRVGRPTSIHMNGKSLPRQKLADRNSGKTFAYSGPPISDGGSVATPFGPVNRGLGGAAHGQQDRVARIGSAQRAWVNVGNETNPQGMERSPGDMANRSASLWWRPTQCIVLTEFRHAERSEVSGVRRRTRVGDDQILHVRTQNGTDWPRPF